MKTVFHPSNTRGHANYGWLDTHHTFSFANYYDADRVSFGALRVLNDDVVQGGKGFGKHPHENMEIVSIPLEGSLKHEDSMGNKHVINENDIQIMSAGTGIYHSEYNKNQDKPVKFLQIWVFPNKQDIEPRYGQTTLNPKDRKNQLQLVVSADPDDDALWICQNAWFYLADFSKNMKFNYYLKSMENSAYLFLIGGKLLIAEKEINRRDGIGIWETDKFGIKVLEKSQFLIMDVPMAI